MCGGKLWEKLFDCMFNNILFVFSNQKFLSSYKISNVFAVKSCVPLNVIGHRIFRLKKRSCYQQVPII